MKYTKEYLKDHKIAVNTGRDVDAVRKIDEIIGIRGRCTTRHDMYGESFCIRLEANGDPSYEDIKYYTKEGYTILSIYEFFSEINETYEVY